MKDPDDILLRTDVVTVGRFRCPVDHPKFRDSGPISQSCMVFPRSSVVIEHDGSRPFVGDPALATLYNTGQQYERRAISAEGDRCDWYAVATDVLCDAVRPLDPAAADNPDRAMRHQHAAVSPSLYFDQRKLFNSLERDVALAPPDVIDVEERVLHLLTRVLRSAYSNATVRIRSQDSRARSQRADIAQEARRIVARTFRRRLGLRGLAACVGCSPFHLCRAFREVTGTTLHAHVTTLRLRAALEHLDDSADVTTVALEAGFSSHSHFTAAFKQSFGLTPSRARRATF
jgi:AraC family transcriptional regulator